MLKISEAEATTLTFTGHCGRRSHCFPCVLPVCPLGSPRPPRPAFWPLPCSLSTAGPDSPQNTRLHSTAHHSLFKTPAYSNIEWPDSLAQTHAYVPKNNSTTTSAGHKRMETDLPGTITYCPKKKKNSKSSTQLAATVIHELHLISQSTFFFDTFVRKLLTFDTQPLKQVIKMQREI